MLDHLCLKARVVAAALLHLAVDDLIKGDLALDIARGLGDLLVRQAALLHLAGAQAKHQTGVVEYVRLAGIVQVDANLLGNANLVSGKAAGIVERLDGIDQVLSNRLVLDGRNLATLPTHFHAKNTVRLLQSAEHQHARNNSVVKGL